LVTISIPAIEPAIATLPVKNQLITNVSSVPNVRQLTALRIDRVCVSAPRNKTTRRASWLFFDTTYHASRIPMPRTGKSRFAESSVDTNGDCVQFGWRNLLNALI